MEVRTDEEVTANGTKTDIQLKRKSKTNCSYKFCISRRTDFELPAPAPYLFAAPKTADQTEWINFIRKLPPDYLPVEEVSRKFRFCYLHFEDRFINKGQTFVVGCETFEVPLCRWRLTSDAYPTLFDPEDKSVATPEEIDNAEVIMATKVLSNLMSVEGEAIVENGGSTPVPVASDNAQVLSHINKSSASPNEPSSQIANGQDNALATTLATVDSDMQCVSLPEVLHNNSPCSEDKESILPSENIVNAHTDPTETHGKTSVTENGETNAEEKINSGQKPQENKAPLNNNVTAGSTGTDGSKKAVSGVIVTAKAKKRKQCGRSLNNCKPSATKNKVRIEVIDLEAEPSDNPSPSAISKSKLRSNILRKVSRTIPVIRSTAFSGGTANLLTFSTSSNIPSSFTLNTPPTAIAQLPFIRPNQHPYILPVQQPLPRQQPIILSANKRKSQQTPRIIEIVQVSSKPTSNGIPNVVPTTSSLTAKDLAHLVMPTPDWNVNTYPEVFAISETVMSQTGFEIIRKSISVTGSWAIKFSVYGQEISLLPETPTSTVAELQEVLNRFSAVSICAGLNIDLFKSQQQKMALIKEQLCCHVDHNYRSNKCPLVLPKSPDPSEASAITSRFNKHQLVYVCKQCHDFIYHMKSNNSTTPPAVIESSLIEPIEID